jgi:excisionase family DNA binding protein
MSAALSMPNIAPAPLWLTVTEAAERARRHPDTVRAACKSGELEASKPSTKSGKGHWRITTEAVDRWVRGEPAPVVVPVDRRRKRT